MLDTWEAMSPFMETAISASERWPAAIHALTHERDVRGALSIPGAHDHESVRSLARRLAESTTIRVELEDGGVVGNPNHRCTSRPCASSCFGFAWAVAASNRSST
jgi:hypothetical protein